MVLFLFVIMLLNIQEKEGKIEGSKLLFQFVSILIVGSSFIAIANLAKADPNLVQIVSEANIFGTVKSVARLLFTDFLLPFEIASILLLAAMVGAVILAKRRIDD
jgi:NADH-quinone oxidoreductase subunit J